MLYIRPFSFLLQSMDYGNRDETLQPFAKGDFLFARRTFTGRFEAGIRELGKISTADEEPVYFGWTGSAVTALAFRYI